MPRDAASFEEYMARQLVEYEDQLPAAVADERGAPPFAVKLSDEDELRLWWATDASVVPEQLYAQGATPSDVMRALYPYREKLMQGDGRLKITRQAEYAERMASRSARLLEDEPDAEILQGVRNLFAREPATLPEQPGPEVYAQAAQERALLQRQPLAQQPLLPGMGV